MEPRLHVITLAVEDLERSLAFYRDGLGLNSAGIVGSRWTDEKTGANGAIAVFKLEGGLMLSLYPRGDLAKDAEIESGPAQSGEFSLGQLVQPRACRPAPRPSNGRRRGGHRGARPTVGHLLRLLPRPRRPPLGDHLEPVY